MLFLTDFADQAVVLPLALVVGFTFVAVGWRRGAIAWAIAIAATLAAILVAKLAAFCWGDLLPPGIGLRSPSGHTADAAVAYGSLLALLAPRHWRPPLPALVAASLAATVIGASRLAMHVHTPIDVLIGAVIGIAGAVLFTRLADERPPGLRRSLLLAASIGAVILFHGEHLHSEDGLQRLWHLIRPLACCADQR
jgi:membrane-associated phospholipid phosphatase